ncbi:MAG: FAD-binding oxidoreductase [Hyphomicrobiales bacterium]|nr:FAD-binding oxidoreductase [Rickettsiales bacterium]MCP5361030.1 FAD-binding oxidoreductase [Hyphomicrobiales bacterium]
MNHHAIITSLTKMLGENAVLTQPQDQQPYVTPWRGAIAGKALAIVFPTSTEQVAGTVALCAQHHIPLVPQGGNTGLAGGSVPDTSGTEIVLSLSRMKRIREIDTTNHTAIVEAGCILASLHDALVPHDRIFPMHIASEGSAMIGGIIATNAGGNNVLRYGTTRELVLGLEVVLPDGKIWHGLKKLRKDNTGYDLKQLFMGAEGTLGIITAACLKLFHTHRQTETAFIGLPSAEAALALLTKLRQASGDRVHAFEYISDTALTLVTTHIPGHPHPLGEIYPCYLLIELATAQPGDDLRSLLESTLADAMAEGLVLNAAIAESTSQARQFWSLREHISEAERQIGKGIHFDISVPVSAVPAFLTHADAVIAHAIPEATIVAFGHMGDGNIHYNLSLPKTITPEAFAETKNTAAKVIYPLLKTHHGSISAEHGIGTLRRSDLAAFKPALDLQLMRKIKQAIDPENQMNPGRVITTD